MYGKLNIITLQEKFLKMNHEHLSALLGDHLEIRATSLNSLSRNAPRSDDTILYFIPGIRAMVEQMHPECTSYILARREILICNLRELFTLKIKTGRILVVNDNKINTEEMLQDLSAMNLPFNFVGYYPGQEIPSNIDYIVTSGERALVPAQFQGVPIIDCGLRFISLATIYSLFVHFNIPYDPASLARKYLQTVVTLSEKWPLLGEGRFISEWCDTSQNQIKKFTFDDLVINSAAMKKFVQHTAKIAKTDQTIHLYGEIGTGKKLISQAIHNGSKLKNGPFISINCATRTQEILEKELFGVQRDISFYPSLWESAYGGTLCIEEAGALNEQLQARLLQALTEGRYFRTGGSEYLKIYTRVITTSSTRLDKDTSKPFNKDLLLLLSRYSCRVPTLNERTEDFEDLIYSYFTKHLQNKETRITDEVISELKNFHWQGNIQELYNVLQYMSCTGEGKLTRDELPYFITGQSSQEFQQPQAAHNMSCLCSEIEKHGFLAETIEILKTYLQGKKNNIAYGRTPMQKLLAERGITLSAQQLRLRLEKLNDMGLLIIRPGRSGTTISEKGEQLLKAALNSFNQ
jgi:DNA-binding NtrC family response regulator